MDATKKTLNRMTPKAIFISLLFWIPAGIFLKLAGEAVEKSPPHLDVTILEKIHTFSSPFLDAFFLTITKTGGIAGVIVATLLLATLFIYKKRTNDLAFLLVSVGGATITNIILKAVFHRDRPSLWHQAIVEHSFSFPSGHAMASAALFACLIAIYWHSSRKWLVFGFGIVAVILIGLSRLYLGVHYPSDVIAGWSVSVLWVYVAYRIMRRSVVKPETEEKSDT